ncbi:MAG: agmatine deiminase [Ardenticatenaceae bacterium]|nr:agmatine deiminase [Anaerolineales bacterium]MCB8941675.1 agmatine deiminase [Ardenticatenaceae bacterium]MCB8974430.1 agmatine deiminase [Ardenticatenaceae bacterium]
MTRNNTHPTTPIDDGFRMPGEYEPHAGCWMLWPERPDVWRENGRPAQAAFIAVASATAQFEPVWMGVSAASYAIARAQLPSSVELIELDYNDAWMRDNGPTFVVNNAGELRGIDWDFNAWGGLYQDWKADDRLASQVLGLRGYGRYKTNLVMEGGAIDVDGQGTLIVTEQSLLDPLRNPGRSRAEVEAVLRTHLNVQKVIWIAEGVHLDETNGHVDNLCCFVRPGVVALTWTDDEDDPQYPISLAAFEQLSQETDARERPLQVVKIHQPTPMTLTAEEAAGIATVPGSHPREPQQRLAGSYINYYVANGGVIVPQFNDRFDTAALETIQTLFPDRKVVGVYAREILLGGGNIHCITQQQPIGGSKK